MPVQFGGVAFGLVSFVLIEIIKLAEQLSERIHLWSPLKGLLGGALLLVTLFVDDRCTRS